MRSVRPPSEPKGRGTPADFEMSDQSSEEEGEHIPRPSAVEHQGRQQTSIAEEVKELRREMGEEKQRQMRHFHSRTREMNKEYFDRIKQGRMNPRVDDRQPTRRSIRQRPNTTDATTSDRWQLRLPKRGKDEKALDADIEKLRQFKFKNALHQRRLHQQRLHEENTQLWRRLEAKTGLDEKCLSPDTLEARQKLEIERIDRARQQFKRRREENNALRERLLPYNTRHTFSVKPTPGPREIAMRLVT